MFREELDRIDSVPMLPAMVSRVLGMMDDPNVTAYQLADVVSKDQSLVTSILRIVNSSYYGFHWRISSISQAVVLLGFRTIRNLVLATSVINTFGAQSEESLFDRRVHWKHSIACATGAALLARTWRCCSPEDAFLAGLVHDVGRVIMDQLAPQEFATALKRARDGQMTLFEAEQEVFHITHAEIGRHIALKWSFPDQVAAAIAYHHAPAGAKKWTHLSAVVHTADMMARSANLAVGPWPPVYEAGALDALGQAEEGIEALTQAFAEEFEKSNFMDELVA